MIEKNKINLDNAIQRLPEHEPDPQLWSRISSMMNFENKLTETSASLPEYEPDDELWCKIESGLVEQEKVIHETGIWWRYAISVAATLIFCILLWQLIKNEPINPETSISYTEEIVIHEEPYFHILDAEEESVQNILKSTCQNLPEKCSTPEVIELRNQLEILDSELKALEEDAKKYGGGPDLIKNQIKIENLKATFMKELVQILFS